MNENDEFKLEIALFPDMVFVRFYHEVWLYRYDKYRSVEDIRAKVVEDIREFIKTLEATKSITILDTKRIFDFIDYSFEKEYERIEKQLAYTSINGFDGKWYDGEKIW